MGHPHRERHPGRWVRSDRATGTNVIVVGATRSTAPQPKIVIECYLAEFIQQSLCIELLDWSFDLNISQQVSRPTTAPTVASMKKPRLCDGAKLGRIMPNGTPGS